MKYNIFLPFYIVILVNNITVLYIIKKCVYVVKFQFVYFLGLYEMKLQAIQKVCRCTALIKIFIIKRLHTQILPSLYVHKKQTTFCLCFLFSSRKTLKLSKTILAATWKTAGDIIIILLINNYTHEALRIL